MALDDLPVRDELRGQTPYGAPQLEVAVRLNTNENPYAPSAAVVASIVDHVRDAAIGLNRYPDRDAVLLRDDLARYVQDRTGFEATAAHIWPANGSNEVLQQLLQTFGGAARRALGFEPTYSMHRLIARGTGTEYRSVPRGDGFTLSADDLLTAVRAHDPDVIFLCSPNNPTGTSIDLEVVRAACEQTRAVVVVDEAYAEFSERPSACTLLPASPRLVVVRTLSKALELAGARLGYAVTGPDVVDALQLVRLPYHLSAVTQAVGRAALAHADELLRWVEELKGQRDRMVEALGGLGYVVHPSDANFVFFGGLDDQSVLWRRLLEASVLVRDVGVPGHLRVTAGTPDETSAFLAALAAITKESVA